MVWFGVWVCWFFRLSSWLLDTAHQGVVWAAPAATVRHGFEAWRQVKRRGRIRNGCPRPASPAPFRSPFSGPWGVLFGLVWTVSFVGPFARGLGEKRSIAAPPVKKAMSSGKSHQSCSVNYSTSAPFRAGGGQPLWAPPPRCLCSGYSIFLSLSS